MTWQDWAANFCYLILAVSYLLTDLYWLRVLAIVALGLEGVYFYFGSNPPLWVGLGWAVVFVGINLVQLTVMTRERLAVRMSEREQRLHRGLFAELLVIAGGTVKIIVGGEVIALQQAGSFVGEMSFMSGEHASADVAADGRVVLLAIARPALDRLLARDQGVATALFRVLGHGLAAKLKERQPRAAET